jgi:SagB-type dehydrogenase family enzyme
MIKLEVICGLIIIFFCHTNSYADNQDMKVRLKPAQLVDKNLKSLLESRYSCRSFQNKSLNLDAVATVLWATCGRRHDAVASASRTIPSAGATYPLELYLVVGKDGVDKLKEGLYHYLIDEHALEFILPGDRRSALAAACLGQGFIKDAPVSLVIAAKFNRTTNRYGARGGHYVYAEAGHACQNTYLSVANLGLGTVEVGAFGDDSVKAALNLEKDYAPLIVMPIGYPKD